MNPRQRPPCPADRVEGPAAIALDPRFVRERGVDPRAQLGRPALQRHQPERSQGKRRLLVDPALVESDQFQRPAAQVAHGAVGRGDSRKDAQGRQPRLLRPADHRDVEGAAAGEPRQRKTAPSAASRTAAVARMSTRSTSIPSREGGEPDQDCRWPSARPSGFELPGCRQGPAQAAHDFLVEHRDRCAGQPVVDDQPDRVGADVDHADAARARPGDRSDPKGLGHLWRRSVAEFLHQLGRPVGSLQGRCPGPTGWGLVMNQRWALKASSGASDTLVDAVGAEHTSSTSRPSGWRP